MSQPNQVIVRVGTASAAVIGASALAGSGQNSDMTQAGILIADDDGAVRTMLEMVLRERGFAVWLTGSGSAAIDIFRHHRQEIDLVLLDVQMPEIDGPGTLAALKELDAEVRCVFMSGDTGRYSKSDLLALGAILVIEKPFGLDALRSIETLLSGARTLTPPRPA